MKIYYITILCTLFLVSSCANQSETSTRNKGDFDKLKKWMTGTFASSKQHLEDNSFFDITLHMYPIWPEESGEDVFYLYVEQAVTFKQDEPYRQRVYKVTREGTNQFKSSIYLIPEDEKYIGAFRSSLPLEDLEPNDLMKKEGCAVMLTFADKAFRGSTKGKNCPSELQGASYATSEVVIEKDQIYSWDKGFDSSDNQVWGAEKGGYKFDRIK